MVYINENTTFRNQQTNFNPNEENSENSQNSLNPRGDQEQTHKQGPLSRRYTEASVQGTAVINSPTLQEYWDEDFSNVTSAQHGINSLSFNMLAANIDLQSLTARSQPDRLENLVMDWIVPDGQNKRLLDHRSKSMVEGTSPDVHYLKQFRPDFSSPNFLTDMITGYVFVLHRRRWIRTELTYT